MKMQHYITEIKINQLRHLSDISISLNTENRQHLIITGKNGSGKTSLLLAVQKYLQAINDGKLNRLNDIYIPQSLELEESLKAVQTEKEKYEIKHCSIKSILLSLHPQNANTNSLIKIIISNGNKN